MGNHEHSGAFRSITYSPKEDTIMLNAMFNGLAADTIEAPLVVTWKPSRSMAVKPEHAVAGTAGNSGASNVGECAAYWLTRIVGEVNGYPAGLSKKAVVLRVRDEFPECKVTVKSISSYVSYIRNDTRGFGKFGDLPRVRPTATDGEREQYASYLASIGKSE